jgi:hypothetical protein
MILQSRGPVGVSNTPIPQAFDEIGRDAGFTSYSLA